MLEDIHLLFKCVVAERFLYKLLHSFVFCLVSFFSFQDGAWGRRGREILLEVKLVGNCRFSAISLPWEDVGLFAAGC